MLGKINLDNLKIRTKLVALLVLPLLGLLVFSATGYSQRNDTARRAATDEDIVAAAAATAELINAMHHETIESVVSITQKRDENDLRKLREATDKAFDAFVEANDGLDLSDKAEAGQDPAVLLATQIDSGIGQFKGIRTQDTDWYTRMTDYQASISGFIEYVTALANVTKSPNVVDPLQQLGAILEYNQKTNILSTFAVVAGGSGDAVWAAPPKGNPSGKSLQDIVYRQILEQDKANTVLTRLAGSSGTVANYMTQKVSPPTDLSLVLTDTWKTALPMATQTNIADLTLEGLVPPSSKIEIDDAQNYATQLAGAATNLATATMDALEHARKDAVRDARFYVFAAFILIVIAIAAALWISLSITRRVTRLTDAADRLSHEQLPRLVDSLKNPAEDDVSYLTSSFSEIDVTGTDEVGQLAGAFNRIQGVAVQVATEQAQLLRKGIGDMFVNLARRNQGLLDRQIEFIDQLESAEEDPDQLENLFRLDHLATRMRRNAESLLVLAGAEPSRRRGKPVPLADVVRAAVGEVEDFARIDMLQFDDVLVASNAALDIAHLLSELMENAANFSPPDTRVEVVGHRTKAEGYVVSVTDHGIGMAPDALAEANDLLARPPLVGLALSRSLGFIVIGRLAARFGIAVRLMPSPSSGTTAMVSLPPSLITDQPRTPATPAEISNREAPERVPPASEDPAAIVQGTDRRPTPRRTAPAAKAAPPAPTAPARAASSTSKPGLPTRGAESGAPSATPRRVPKRGGEPTPGAPQTLKSIPSVPQAVPVVTAEAPDNPVSTSGGLTKRVPRSAGGQRAVPGGDGKRAATQNRRSPEEVRSMLSRYRSGMQQGRDDDSAKNPEEDGK